MHGGYVICCKTSLPGAGKTRNMYLFFQKQNFSLLFATTFRNLQQTDLLQDRIDSWMVKLATSLFCSFFQQCYKSSYTFFLPILPPLIILATFVNFYHSLIKQPQASKKK